MRKILLLSLLLFTALLVKAQVNVDAHIDSVQLMVGEQTVIRLETSVNANDRVQFPFLREKEIVPGLEVVEEAPVDTEYIDDGKRMMLSKKYTVTAFDSSLYYIPPFVIKVNGKDYKTKSLALKVLTVNVDMRHPDRFAGPKDIVDVPFSWSDYVGICWAAFCLLVLFLAFIYLFARDRDNRPILRRIKIKPQLPPHKWAMKEIERIKSEVNIQAENSKEYYTQLTDTLRSYIFRRYGFNAKEMTSAEIIERLIQMNDDEALNDLRQLFVTADLVKFAKYSAPTNENDSNLLKAIDYINSTKLEVTVPLKPEKPVVTVEEQRSRKLSLTIKSAIIGIAVVGCALLYYIGSQLYNLLF